MAYSIWPLGGQINIDSAQVMKDLKQQSLCGSFTNHFGSKPTISKKQSLCGFIRVLQLLLELDQAIGPMQCPLMVGLRFLRLAER